MLIPRYVYIGMKQKNRGKSRSKICGRGKKIGGKNLLIHLSWSNRFFLTISIYWTGSLLLFLQWRQKTRKFFDYTLYQVREPEGLQRCVCVFLLYGLIGPFNVRLWQRARYTRTIDDKKGKQEEISNNEGRREGWGGWVWEFPFRDLSKDYVA